MFWRERERDGDQNGGPPRGQVRVLVVGDAGVGKTSLVHLILKGSSIARPSQTVGCTVGVKAAKEARYDKEALIRRRYFSNELPSSSPWSMSPLQNSTHRTDETSSDEDQFHRRVSLSGDDSYKYNVVPPLSRSVEPYTASYAVPPAARVSF
ncbi:hypothetical protein OPV22_024056 [Ensete ventricosum]|uniref:Uncharacterized protein n=1 Tax=Ensete ventricosum TaxID=4639 RepID=A0AAV8QTL9_ENSVE|nr:hypothetical protein OPV22_024056 [Ensete ventricosum]